MTKKIYAIKDMENKRFASWRSAPIGINNEQLWITYNGKLGTDFFTIVTEAEKVVAELKSRIHKVLEIVEVNPNTLSLGKHFLEVI